MVGQYTTTILNWSRKHPYTHTETKGPGQRGSPTGFPIHCLRLSSSDSASYSRTATSASCAMPPRSYAATRCAWAASQIPIFVPREDKGIAEGTVIPPWCGSGGGDRLLTGREKFNLDVDINREDVRLIELAARCCRRRRVTVRARAAVVTVR